MIKTATFNNFEKLPEYLYEIGKYASFFKEFNLYLKATRLQGFKWQKLKYSFDTEDKNKKEVIELAIDENTYPILALRYKELFSKTGGGGGGGNSDVPHEIESYSTKINTDKIDTFLQFNNMEILTNADNISKKTADKLAEDKYKKFHQNKITQKSQKKQRF